MPHALFHLALGILLLVGSIPFAERLDKAVRKPERVMRGVQWMLFCLTIGALYWLTYY
jgi:hypothetical protein